MLVVPHPCEGFLDTRALKDGALGEPLLAALQQGQACALFPHVLYFTKKHRETRIELACFT